MPDAASSPVLPAVRPRFRALARAIVPETAELDEEGWSRLESIVEDALGKRPPAMQRQLLLFIRALDLLPVVRWGHTFRGLDADRRLRFLHAVQQSPIFLFRRGFWGLRTLVYMGYYGRPAAYDAVGYGARLRGWAEHPDAPAEARALTLAARHDHPASDGARDEGGPGDPDDSAAPAAPAAPDTPGSPGAGDAGGAP